jgi:hypothetical protein
MHCRLPARVVNGAPLGRAAWGGAHVHLPTGFRIASAFATGIWTLAAFIVLARAGFEIQWLTLGLVRVGAWVLVGMLALGALMNFASPSSWEWFLWGPVGLILTLLCLVVVRSALPSP